MCTTGMLYRILILLLFYCGIAQAQKPVPKTDKIVKKDKTILDVLVKEINRADIYYSKPHDPTGPLFGIAKSEVWKIIWNNGEEEIINMIASTVEPAPEASKPKATDLLVKKAPAAPRKFWDQQGLYFGAGVAGGVGFPVKPVSNDLSSKPFPTGAAGIGIGFRKNNFTVRLDAIGIVQSYAIHLPETRLNDPIISAKGLQGNLLIPVTVTRLFKVGGIRTGVYLGGYGNLQLGSGGTQVAYAEKSSVRYSNCSDCGLEGISAGAVAGLSFTVLEKPRYAIVAEARWYHNFKDNSDYKRTENGISAHYGLIGITLLRNLHN